MSQPIMRGQFAMDQMRTNLLAEAANTIDMYLRGPITLTLRGLSKGGGVLDGWEFKVPAWLYMNSDDGTFTIAMPTKLPEQITNDDRTETSGVFTVDYEVYQDEDDDEVVDNFWNTIERIPNPPATPSSAKSTDRLHISEMTTSKCYLFRSLKGVGTNKVSYFPECEQGGPDAKTTILDNLYIPPGTTRIGALVLKPYWTFSGFSATDAPAPADGH